ncbi:hypothetical protein B296_00056866 [Ensete ventricosum]|uniref:Uncharacterized protein n=1 Tax=Ensete ventricosum TaxID=4639 RepID=A0A426WX98_ENSVE|nr:hypothetical protein B296_00056866 [Ensete ventricosum]
MVMEIMTTRRGSGFRRATGSGEEEEVGARQAAGSDEGWLRLRCAAVAGSGGALLCVDGEEEGVGGNSKAEEAAGKNGKQRLMTCGSGGRVAGGCEKEVAVVGCSGCSGRWQGWQGWPAVMKRRGGTTVASGGRSSRGRGSSGGKDGRGEGCGSRVERNRAAIVRQGRQRERRRQQRQGKRRQRPAAGGDEAVEEEGGCARVEQRPRRVWLRLRLWLRRKEEGSDSPARVAVVGEKKTGWMGVAVSTTEAQMRCGSRKRRRCHCAPTGKKELAAATKQRRQRGRMAGSGLRRVAATAGEEQGRRGKARKRW